MWFKEKKKKKAWKCSDDDLVQTQRSTAMLSEMTIFSQTLGASNVQNRGGRVGFFKNKAN